MRDGRTDFFGDVDRGQQGTFLVARWTGTALLAGEGDKHLVPTVRAANPGKAFLRIATLEKGCHRLLNDAAPVAVLGLKTLVKNLWVHERRSLPRFT